jgi:hypothetical protein
MTGQSAGQAPGTKRTFQRSAGPFCASLRLIATFYCPAASTHVVRMESQAVLADVHGVTGHECVTGVRLQSLRPRAVGAYH